MNKKPNKRMRLSMKLLWKYLNQYFRESEDARTLRIDKVTDFLNYVEEQMKPLKP